MLFIYKWLNVIIISLGLISSAGAQEISWNAVNREIADKYPEVKFKSVESLRQVMGEDENLVIIDTRDEQEFKISHLKKAVNLNNTESIQKAYPNKDTEIILYCSVGYRSAGLADKLRQKGYKNIYNLKGSVFEWANKGYPLYRGLIKVKYVHPCNGKWGKLLNKEMHQYKIE